GTLAHTLDDGAPERRREAGRRAGVARRPGGNDSNEERVAVAVVAHFLDGERRARRLALLPEALARPAPEPRLTGLERQPESFVVHPGEHQHAAVARVLHDRGPELRPHRARGRRVAEARRGATPAAPGARAGSTPEARHPRPPTPQRRARRCPRRRRR